MQWQWEYQVLLSPTRIHNFYEKKKQHLDPTLSE